MAYEVCFRMRANHEQGTEVDKQESMREAAHDPRNSKL